MYFLVFWINPKTKHLIDWDYYLSNFVYIVLVIEWNIHIKA